QRLKALENALAADPSSLPLRRERAAALAALGQVDRAIGEYRKIATLAPELYVELARLLLLNIRSRPAAEQHWAEVEEALAKVPETKQKDPEVRLLRADLRAAQGKFDESRRLIEAERDRNPGQVGPWLALAALAERQGRRDDILPL